MICKVHGFAVAGGSDIALCCDLVVMEDTAQIGYMPTRVWGCPTTAMWTYRLGAEKAKRMLLTGDKITGTEAADMGLVLKAVPAAELDAKVERLAERMATVPINQLMMQKMVINQAIEAMGVAQTQRLATVFDGTRRKGSTSRSGPKMSAGSRRSKSVIAGFTTGRKTGRSTRDSDKDWLSLSSRFKGSELVATIKAWGQCKAIAAIGATVTAKKIS